MNSLGWLLQWPVRGLILMLVAALPLGVEVESFGVGLIAAVVIGLLGTLLNWPLKLLLSPIWAVFSVGGLIPLVSFLCDWLISIILFSLAAWLIHGFRLRRGLISAVLGSVVYSVVSIFILQLLHIPYR